jgi:ketosteroid isomerase-like protein
MGYISAAGMKESEREAEARKPIDDFFAAFNARDLERGRRTLHYPHIQIAGNDVTILEDPESFQIDFQSLASDGWTHVTLDSCAMRQNCDEKVHFEVQLSMHKGSESRYATYQALWIVTRKDGAWGIQCRSIFPSGVRFS